jgi:hypothetical protein
LAYQPPANSTFLSQQISHQQPVSSTFLLEQTSTSHQPPAKRTGYKTQQSTCSRQKDYFTAQIHWDNHQLCSCVCPQPHISDEYSSVEAMQIGEKNNV